MSAKQQLEHLLLQASPTHVHANSISHQALEDLRNAGDPQFLFLRTLLELTTSNSTQFHGSAQLLVQGQDEVLFFHCITGVRHVVLMGWPRFSPIFTAALRDWSMLLGHSFCNSCTANNGPGPNNKTLQNACYTTSVSLWKRSWLELQLQQQQQQQQAQQHPQQQQQHPEPPMTPEQQQLLEGMQQTPAVRLFLQTTNSRHLPFLQSPQHLQQYLEHSILPQSTTNHINNATTTTTTNTGTNTGTGTGTSTTITTLASTYYLQQLVEEFAGTKSAVTYQLPLEFHQQTRQSFESSGAGSTTSSGGGGATTPHNNNNNTQHNSGGLTSCLHLAMNVLSQLLPTISSQPTNNNIDNNNDNDNNRQQEIIITTTIMMQIVCDCLEWEFGANAFATTNSMTNTAGGGSGGTMQQHDGNYSTFHYPSSEWILRRPPKHWRAMHLTAPEFVQILWKTHHHYYYHIQQRTTTVTNSTAQKANPNGNLITHTIRQLLLLLASLDGPIFASSQERKNFLAEILQGTLALLQHQVGLLSSTSSGSSSNGYINNTDNGDIDKKDDNDEALTEVMDTLDILTRLVTNGKWPLLIQFHKDPLLPALLHGLTAIGRTLWEQHVRDATSVQGDLASMEHGDVREDVLNQLLGAVSAVTGDSWLWYSSASDERNWAKQQVAAALGPLYGIWIQGRLQLAAWEEYYLTTSHEQDDVEEDHEYISAVQLEEEIQLLSTLGRVHVKSAIASLSTLFQQTIPQLQAQWNSNISSTAEVGVVSPELAGLLEQTRLLTLYIGHLLTDDNTGETPVIPDTIVMACRDDDADTVTIICSAVEALLSLTQNQALKLAEQPNDPRLSPLLANSFLWFLNRWAPAYIYSVEYNNIRGLTAPPEASARNIGAVWSSPDKAQHAISFAITLCLQFQCYWPQERPVQENASSLLMTLAKRADGRDLHGHHVKLRSLMIASPSFTQMVLFHCLTAGTRHSMARGELEHAIRIKAQEAHASVDMSMVTGYQRLPYDIKSSILSALLVACSEPETEGHWQDCCKAVQDSFSFLFHALSSRQVDSNDINAKEMTCLCIEMFRGMARASEMAEPSRIPAFMTPHLSNLSGMMKYYAADLTICERLLQFFRDYTEQFVIMLDRDQCLTLFRASAELLKSYSTHHCNSKTRLITAKLTVEANLEEEQKYGDILCAIQLLIHLGTKDFIDICASSDPSSSSYPSVASTQVTDIIFFGLQQILPLMTQGLLQMPTLCSQYFSLVGFMMETYPEKIAVLPYELFDALLESLLFGMCHHDAAVAKSSLQGIASITREHSKSHVLTPHLSRNPDLLDHCSRRLLTDVVFQNKVWDRLESAGMALLPLAAVDVNRFANVVSGLINQIPDDDQKVRLQNAFSALVQPEVLQKVGSGGLEGRKNRIQFKKDFDVFCHTVHSFLILK